MVTCFKFYLSEHGIGFGLVDIKSKNCYTNIKKKRVCLHDTKITHFFVFLYLRIIWLVFFFFTQLINHQSAASEKNAIFQKKKAK